MDPDTMKPVPRQDLKAAVPFSVPNSGVDPIFQDCSELDKFISVTHNDWSTDWFRYCAWEGMTPVRDDDALVLYFAAL